MHGSKDPCKTWTQYCEEIGSSVKKCGETLFTAGIDKKISHEAQLGELLKKINKSESARSSLKGTSLKVLPKVRASSAKGTCLLPDGTLCGTIGSLQFLKQHPEEVKKGSPHWGQPPEEVKKVTPMDTLR
jgi:hypothetical protein